MALDHFIVHEDCAYFRPSGQVAMDSLVSLFRQAMAECQALQIGKLLVNTKMLAHPPLNDAGRFTFGTAIAEKWDRSIKLALVLRGDQRDREGFGSAVASNRGLVFGTFATEEAAVAWLRSGTMAKGAPT